MKLKMLFSAAAAVFVMTGTAYAAAAAASPTMYGIDVSTFQGEIDWEIVYDNIDYAILRCGYGSDFTSQDDKRWKRNADECTRLKIPFGVYIYSYADTVEKAESEAEHVLRLIDGYDLSFPVYYDMEDKCQLELSTDELGDIAKSFCDIVSAAGYEVGIYANTYWWEHYLTDPVFDTSSWYRWVAQYNTRCTYSGPYTMWQFSSEGEVDGILGNVDTNYWYGALRGANGSKVDLPQSNTAPAASPKPISTPRPTPAPTLTPPPTAEPVISATTEPFVSEDIGDNVYSYIVNSGSQKVIAADEDYYVYLKKYTGSSDQLWHFDRENDGSYVITSVADKKVLSAETDSDENGIRLCVKDNIYSNNQRWIIESYDGHYRMRPKSSVSRVIDLMTGSTDEGTVIQLWKKNSTPAQTYTLEPRRSIADLVTAPSEIFTMADYGGYIEITNNSGITQTATVIINCYNNGQLCDVQSSEYIFSGGKKQKIKILSGTEHKVYVYSSKGGAAEIFE